MFGWFKDLVRIRYQELNTLRSELRRGANQ